MPADLTSSVEYVAEPPENTGEGTWLCSGKVRHPGRSTYHARTIMTRLTCFRICNSFSITTNPVICDYRLCHIRCRPYTFAYPPVWQTIFHSHPPIVHFPVTVYNFNKKTKFLSAFLTNTVWKLSVILNFGSFWWKDRHWGWDLRHDFGR